MNMSNSALNDIHLHLTQLLNTRTLPEKQLENSSLLLTSILNYGIADIFHLDFTDTVNQDILCKNVKTAIMNFEPRLTHLSVNCYIDPEVNPLIQIHINAMLTSNPQQLMQFEYQLNPIQQRITA